MNPVPTDPLSRALLNARLAHLSPQQVLRWAVDTFGPELVMTSSFGLNGVALIHMLQAISRELPIVFVDTGYLFPETLETRRRIEATFGVRVLTYRPCPGESGLPRPANAAGGSAQGADLCCAARKVEPMNRAMAELEPVAVLNARARFQANTQASRPYHNNPSGIPCAT